MQAVNRVHSTDACHIKEVYAEIPVTRRELGTPPLVRPASQIVVVQAIFDASPVAIMALDRGH
jgi:pyruvate carboxylase subunit B